MTQFVAPLTVEQLYRTSDVGGLAFKTSDELSVEELMPGQGRALDAIAFAADIPHKGYNLFVLGPPGTGKHSAVQAVLGRRAAAKKAPPDWVYVRNFADANRPRALSLPPTRGRKLRDAVHRLIEDIRSAIPAVFESEDHQSRREAIDDEYQQRQERALIALREQAEAKNIALMRTPMGFALAPMQNGKVLRPEAFEHLPDADRARIRKEIEELQESLESMLRQVPRWEKERRDRIRSLNEEMTALAVGHSIDEVKSEFLDLPQVIEHIEAVRADLIQNVHNMIGAEHVSQQTQGENAAPTELAGFRRYEVNLLVGAEKVDGAPLVYEDNPTLPNLLGRVEHLSQMGLLVTDLTLIKPGALHRANGGYLILDAVKVLTQPFAWEALKRALRAACITIESIGTMLSLISTASLEPEPVPLDIKVALCGEPLIYYLLELYDPEFREMFKIAAEFDDSMRRTSEGEASFARLLAGLAKREKLLPLDRAAIARIIERCARLAEDAERLSLRLEEASELVREADHLARTDAAAVIGAKHVDRAVDLQLRRTDRLRERHLEAIMRNVVLISSTGTQVGQVNGLSVVPLANASFGHPVRITARVRMGSGRVIDIEREAKLGGPIHSKGVLILGGYLMAQFALDAPLSLAASIVFEQSYGGVEGDSASLAELCALLSAIAEAPLRQDLAVTGSINQHGEVQPIGGVNEKIEGFFDVCRERGLTGEQGVLIPAANVKHLMLRADVVAASRAGRFHVYPITRVDEGVALLSGLDAGVRDSQGRFPDASLFARVEARLQDFARRRSSFGPGRDSGSADG